MSFIDILIKYFNHSNLKILFFVHENKIGATRKQKYYLNYEINEFFRLIEKLNKVYYPINLENIIE